MIYGNCLPLGYIYLQSYIPQQWKCIMTPSLSSITFFCPSEYASDGDEACVPAVFTALTSCECEYITDG